MFDHQRRDLRHLNGIIDRMVAANLVSKLLVQRAGRTGGTVGIPYVKLVESADSDEDEEPAGKSILPSSPAEIDGSTCRRRRSRRAWSVHDRSRYSTDRSSNPGSTR